MRKLVVISLVLVFACAMAHAAAPNWVLAFKSSRPDGTSHGVSGGVFGLLDNTTDTSGVTWDPFPGDTLAYAVFADSGTISEVRDAKKMSLPQTWTFNVYYKGADTIPTIMFQLLTTGFDPTVGQFTFGGAASSVGTVGAANILGTSFTVPGAPFASPTQFTVTYSNVPEPASLAALGMGLFTVAGFANRRRRK